MLCGWCFKKRQTPKNGTGNERGSTKRIEGFGTLVINKTNLVVAGGGGSKKTIKQG